MELLVAAGAALTTTGFLFGVEATKAAIADREDEEEPEPSPDNASNTSPSNKVVLSSARDNAEKPQMSPEVSTFRPRRYGSTEVSPGRALLISAFGMTENITDASEKKFKANEDSHAALSSPEWSQEEIVALDEREPSGGYWMGSQHASDDVIISTPRNDGSMRFHEFR